MLSKNLKRLKRVVESIEHRKTERDIKLIYEAVNKLKKEKQVKRIDDVFGMTLFIIKYDAAKQTVDIISSCDFIHPNQIRLLRDSALWQGGKRIELKNNGIDIEDCLLVATDIQGLKRPNWLFDRISKHEVIVL
ncbi:hypothetical protein DRO69_07160 [Candidatus Bathyarchaeota archaeon]|nr:MAG: hypothetical protein DRO69_07160 [Candidatus Bathyarchaeota archaeon]